MFVVLLGVRGFLTPGPGFRWGKGESVPVRFRLIRLLSSVSFYRLLLISGSNRSRPLRSRFRNYLFRVPIWTCCPRPGDMIIFWRPEYILRHRDGSWAYYPAWDVDVWWYCGKFEVTAYQFILESAYLNADGTLSGLSSHGTTDSGNKLLN